MGRAWRPTKTAGVSSMLIGALCGKKLIGSRTWRVTTSVCRLSCPKTRTLEAIQGSHRSERSTIVLLNIRCFIILNLSSLDPKVSEHSVFNLSTVEAKQDLNHQNVKML